MERMSSGHWMGSGCGEYLRRGLGKEEQRWRRGGVEKVLGNSFLFSQQVFIECLLCADNFLDAEDTAVKRYIKNPYLHEAYILIGKDSQ